MLFKKKEYEERLKYGHSTLDVPNIKQNIFRSCNLFIIIECVSADEIIITTVYTNKYLLYYNTCLLHNNKYIYLINHKIVLIFVC